MKQSKFCHLQPFKLILISLWTLWCACPCACRWSCGVFSDGDDPMEAKLKTPVLHNVIRSPRSEEQGKNWTDPRGKQLICTARSPGNEEKVREIKEAGWEEVGKFRVGKNFWTSTGANLRKTRAFLGGGAGGYLLRCSERKSVWPRYHGSKISGGVCCAFHKHAQPRSQSSSGISDVRFPVKTRERLSSKTNDETRKHTKRIEI